ncbi:Rz-like spanin [Pantoea phage PdC23]|uniref:Adhesin n=1 Tax=Pantoea phage PdC23 TaxID=2894356 RepID=A0AAE8YHG6_9CAUD|nr:Rz-like spanin [Pantoea phage PdC23]UGC97743.1 adhesin [Pantoea phage PdC23]
MKPIYLTDHDIDVMDSGTKRQILEHDEKWDKLCGGEKK